MEVELEALLAALLMTDSGIVNSTIKPSWLTRGAAEVMDAAEAGVGVVLGAGERVMADTGACVADVVLRV